HFVTLHPDGTSTTVVTNNRWRDPLEGQVKATFVHADHARHHEVRLETITHGAPLRVGRLLREHVGKGAIEELRPIARVTTTQDGTTSEYRVEAHDAFGRPTLI